MLVWIDVVLRFDNCPGPQAVIIGLCHSVESPFVLLPYSGRKAVEPQIEGFIRTEKNGHEVRQARVLIRLSE